jgi:hypothetical protein
MPLSGSSTGSMMSACEILFWPLMAGTYLDLGTRGRPRGSEKKKRGGGSFTPRKEKLVVDVAARAGD